MERLRGQAGRVTHPRRRVLEALGRLQRPSTPKQIAQAAGINTYNDHTHSRNWHLGWGSIIADIQPDRHDSAANCLFADGHVEGIPEARLKARIEAGDNFAKPPK